MNKLLLLASFVKGVPRRALGLAFMLAAALFFVLYLRHVDWQRLSQLHFAWWNLIAATVFALFTRYWFVMIWRYILRDLGADKLPRFSILADVYAKAWMGRYIPGTVTWIAGKVYMASSHGISKKRLAVSALLEGGMQVAAIMLVALLLLGFDPRLNVIPQIYKILMVILAGLILLTLVPAVFNRLVKLVFTVLRSGGVDSELLINEKAALRAFGLYVVGSFILGLSEFFISRTIVPGLSWHDFWFIVGAFNLAGALGMVAIGVPSGLGVRDGVLVLLLSAIVPKEIALAITVTSRLWSAVSDVLLFGLASLIRRLIDKSAPAQQRQAS